jgi:hypothetical protein
MAIMANDGLIQVHKFLKDADALLGSIDNLIENRTNMDTGSEALPQLGTVEDMAHKLRERLALLSARRN